MAVLRVVVGWGMMVGLTVGSALQLLAQKMRAEAETTRLTGAVAGNLWTALQRPRRMV